MSAGASTVARQRRPAAATAPVRPVHRTLTAVAVAVGLALRLAWVAYAHRRPLGLFDPSRYAGYADLIADGSGYVQFTSGEATAYYPPGYPFFLGAIEWLGRSTPLSDDLPLTAGVVQAVLGAATVWMGALLARRLFGPAAGVVAAFVLAVYPNLVFHTGALLSETLFNALLVGSLLALLARPWGDGIGRGRLIGAAALFAAAVMVRPISVAIIPVLALAWWLHDRDLRVVLGRTAAFVGVLAVFVVPWTARNLLRMDELVVMSTNTGDNLCIGHHPGADGTFSFSPACDDGESLAQSAASEVRHDRNLTRESLRFIADDPLAEVPRTWGRLEAMFATDHDGLWAVQSYGTDRFISDARMDLLRRLATASYVVVMVAGVAGMVLVVARRDPEALVLVGATLAIIAVPLLFFGDPRFKVPAMPLVAIASAATWAAVRDRFGSPTDVA